MQARRGQAGSTRPRKVAKNANVGLPAPPPVRPIVVGLFALPHAHGHARVQRAQPCSAVRGRQPAGIAPGNGWRWWPEPLRCAVAPLVRDKTFRQPLSAVVPSPAPWRGQGLRGARRSRPGRTAQYYYRTPPHSAQLGFIAVALVLLESCVPRSTVERWPETSAPSREQNLPYGAAS